MSKSCSNLGGAVQPPMMLISSGEKEIDMNNRNGTNPGMAVYLLIPLGAAWISRVIRWGMLRIAGLAAISAWVLLSKQLKITNKERSQSWTG
jgi:hypothetical protein